jgi:SAM-dependent methyltransferase
MAKMFKNADAYERFMGRWSARLGAPFLDFVSTSDGDEILDVGCGTGSLVESIAQSTKAARVVGVDPVEGFIGFCRARFPESRFSFDQGSAFDLPYSDGTFDCALSLLVLMLIPDPDKAAGEMRRVTKPGGTVAACTWDGAGMEMSAIVWEEASKLDPATEARAERPKHCNRKGQLAALWRETGLVDIEEVMLEIQTDFESFDDYWLPYLDGVGPTGGYVAGLPEDRRNDLATALRNRLLAGRAEGPISLSARAWAVRGTVPD